MIGPLSAIPGAGPTRQLTTVYRSVVLLRPRRANFFLFSSEKSHDRVVSFLSCEPDDKVSVSAEHSLSPCRLRRATAEPGLLVRLPEGVTEW